MISMVGIVAWPRAFRSAGGGQRGTTRMGLADEGGCALSLQSSSFGGDQSHLPLICGHLQDLLALPAELLVAR